MIRIVRCLSLVTMIFSLLVFTAYAQEDGQPGSLHSTLELLDVDGVMVPFQSGAPVPDFEPQDRDTLSLGGPWKKQRVHVDHNLSFSARDAAGLDAIETEAGGRHTAAYNDGGWTTRQLPGVEAGMPGDEDTQPAAYHDGVWYRRVVNIPAEWAGNTNRFVCLGANYIFDLWINGQWVGVHEGGYTPFAFDVSDYLDYGADNQFAIRIDKPFPGLRQDQLPAWFLMDWWDYAGVIQDIYLDSAPPVHVVRAHIVPLDYNGNMVANVVVANDGDAAQAVTVDVDVFHADADSPAYLTDPRPSAIVGERSGVEGETQAEVIVEAGGLTVVQFWFRIKSVERWTPTEPNLYVMVTELADNMGQVDVHHNQFGVRTVERDSGKLMFNGRVAFFPGVARHEEWPDTGRTASFDRIVTDLQVIKDVNALFLRTGHYPNHIYTYLLTDRIGFATMVEIPAYWQMSWNWTMQNERGLVEQMFREMVLSNYNRPSIILWGTNNECVFLFNVKITQANAAMVHDQRNNYYDGRLVTQSPAADPTTWRYMWNTTEAVDVAGWTMYYGVFYGDDMYTETLDLLEQHLEQFPEHPFIATEYGYWSGGDDSEEQKQADVFNGTWPAFAEMGALDAQGNINPNGNVAATSWFCVFNWFTKSGLPDLFASYLQSMGLIHMDRTDWKQAAFDLGAAYEPYTVFGGLGPEPGDYLGPDDDVDDDDTTPADDDDTAPVDDDDTLDDDDDDDNDDDDDGCGC